MDPAAYDEDRPWWEVEGVVEHAAAVARHVHELGHPVRQTRVMADLVLLSERVARLVADATEYRRLYVAACVSEPRSNVPSGDAAEVIADALGPDPMSEVGDAAEMLAARDILDLLLAHGSEHGVAILADGSLRPLTDPPDFDVDGWNGFDTAAHAAARAIAICEGITIDGDDLRFAILHAGLCLRPLTEGEAWT